MRVSGSYHTNIDGRIQCFFVWRLSVTKHKNRYAKRTFEFWQKSPSLLPYRYVGLITSFRRLHGSFFWKLLYKELVPKFIERCSCLFKYSWLKWPKLAPTFLYRVGINHWSPVFEDYGWVRYAYSLHIILVTHILTTRIIIFECDSPLICTHWINYSHIRVRAC